ncbi:hypothetical protein OIO90_001361 [Microbotryomycetes sp. JL221]|nr:hypothetical protein OIO90_001361 [Microbotryomycetes sp. JL221]
MQHDVNGKVTKAESMSHDDMMTNEGLRSDDLWSSILNSVAGNKGILTKNVIVLGHPRTGKSTLVSRLGSNTGEEPMTASDASTHDDLGLSYNVVNVQDESDQEIMARLGVYQLASPQPPVSSLLPLALSPVTMLDSIVLIMLDWQQPWSFVRHLQAWMNLLHQSNTTNTDERTFLTAQSKRQFSLIDDSAPPPPPDLRRPADEVPKTLDGSTVETRFRHYVEPNATATTSSNTSHLIDKDSPLPDGALTNNLGLDIVIVCSKADHIATLERDRQIKEEQYDYIQQMLRTIALEYGAGVFFTSTTRPESFSRLRSYILHRLFGSSSSLSTTNQSTSTSSSSASSSASREFLNFKFKANVVDKQQVTVPSGWDSWGKIKILRETFEPNQICSLWNSSLKQDDDNAVVDQDRQQYGSGIRKESDQIVANREDRKDQNIVTEYEKVIVDFDSQTLSNVNPSPTIQAEDEQIFLKKHYQHLQKLMENDPRAVFNQRSSSSSTSNNNNNNNNAAMRSTIGPMSNYNLNHKILFDQSNSINSNVSSSSSTTTTTKNGAVEDKSNMMMFKTNSNQGIGVGSTSTLNRSPNLGSSRTRTDGTTVGHKVNVSGSGTSSSSTTTTTTTSPNGGGGAGGQNEVLANFFQSLLAARSSTTGTSTTKSESNSTNSTQNLSPSIDSSTSPQN